MNVLDAIYKRKSIRRFKADKVPKEEGAIKPPRKPIEEVVSFIE